MKLKREGELANPSAPLQLEITTKDWEMEVLRKP
jgi:hypothetical protein